MTLTEEELTYELNFPFSEFEKAYFYEKRNKFLQDSQNEENQGFEDNKTDENTKSFGPKITFKNQRVASKNATLLQSGWKKEQYLKQNLIINYELFLRYREETLIMKECLMLIKNLTENKMTI